MLTAMAVSIYMYVRIVLVLHRRKSIEGRQRVRNQVARMLIVNGVVFFVCQAPYRVLSLNAWICFLTGQPNHLQQALGNVSPWISLVLLHINCLVNPLIYSAMSAQYRTFFMQAFGLRSKAAPRQSMISGRQMENSDAISKTSSI